MVECPFISRPFFSINNEYEIVVVIQVEFNAENLIFIDWQ